MKNQKMIDHLFRQQYGKMVAILSRIFGLRHLQTIEDAVQDTFISAVKSWQVSIPENPEAWLVQSAKNRIIDLFRKIGAEDKRIANIESGIATTAINELFLDHEVNDSVLRMIFTACNPLLNPQEQVAFSLKIISGFSGKEIAKALLQKEETVKKRLSRARKIIQQENIVFKIPQGADLIPRLDRVLEVLYLIFNEGFHSNRKDILIREELCGEAMRLVQILLSNSFTATSNSYALFALFCFQSARLKSKVNEQGELLSIDQQDRSKWYVPLISMGHQHMEKAVETASYSPYHYEAAIAAEHLQAANYSATNWDQILDWYRQLNTVDPNPIHQLNRAVVQLQIHDFAAAKKTLEQIDPTQLEQKAYLYYGTYAEYAHQTGDVTKAIDYLDQAIALVENKMERNYLTAKKKTYLSKK